MKLLVKHPITKKLAKYIIIKLSFYKTIEIDFKVLTKLDTIFEEVGVEYARKDTFARMVAFAGR